MSVDDVSFRRVTGELVSRSILVQQMIDFYQLKLVSGETRVTDFNEGSEIRNLLESFAVDLYNLLEEVDEVTRIAFVSTSYGEWLDKHGSNPLIQLPRELGEVSTGLVTFTIPEATTTEVVVPMDTVLVSEMTGLLYSTVSDGLIPVGEVSCDVQVECLTVGVDGNAESDTITLFDDDTGLYPGLTVTNPDAFVGGLDYEEDDEYRERLLNYNKRDTFGSMGYYTSLCENVEGVHDVDIEPDPEYTRVAFVNGVEKPVPESVLLEVLEVLENPENVVIGHTFSVYEPVYIDVDMSISLGVKEEISTDILEELVYAVFDGGDAINGASFDGLSIGETLRRDDFYNAFFMIDGVETVTVLVDGVEMEDIMVEPICVLRVGSVDFSQSVIV